MPSGSNSTEGSKSMESEVKETGEETDEAKVKVNTLKTNNFMTCFFFMVFGIRDLVSS
jgi:hypothetical protein